MPRTPRVTVTVAASMLYDLDLQHMLDVERVVLTRDPIPEALSSIERLTSIEDPAMTIIVATPGPRQHLRHVLQDRGLEDVLVVGDIGLHCPLVGHVVVDDRDCDYPEDQPSAVVNVPRWTSEESRPIVEWWSDIEHQVQQAAAEWATVRDSGEEGRRKFDMVHRAAILFMTHDVVVGALSDKEHGRPLAYQVLDALRDPTTLSGVDIADADAVLRQAVIAAAELVLAYSLLQRTVADSKQKDCQRGLRRACSLLESIMQLQP